MPPVLIVLVHMNANVMPDTSVMVFHAEILTNAPKEVMTVMPKQIAKILLVPGNVPVKLDSMEQDSNAMTSMNVHPKVVLVTNVVAMIARVMRSAVIHMAVTRVPVKLVGTVMVRHAPMLMNVKTGITTVI